MLACLKMNTASYNSLWTLMHSNNKGHMFLMCLWVRTCGLSDCVIVSEVSEMIQTYRQTHTQMIMTCLVGKSHMKLLVVYSAFVYFKCIFIGYFSHFSLYYEQYNLILTYFVLSLYYINTILYYKRWIMHFIMYLLLLQFNSLLLVCHLVMH